jgi:hypothetical protein
VSVKISNGEEKFIRMFKSISRIKIINYLISSYFECISYYRIY